MGYSYSKRLTLLRRQTDESLEGRYGLFRTVLLSVIALSFISYIIPSLIGSDLQPPSEKEELSWGEAMKQSFSHRVKWLKSSPFSISPGAATIYTHYGQGVVSFFSIKETKKEDAAADEGTFSEIFSWKDHLKRRIVNALLRAGFVVIAFWPFWIIGFVGGYFGLSRSFRSKKTDDFLGVCDRGRTPFYSGIYGPLKTNGNISAIDYSAPGLACPSFAPEQEANSHVLSSTLQRYRALNRTNTDLVRVILQYRDFPCLVETEMSSQQEHEPVDVVERPLASSISPFVTNAGGTIEQSAIAGLPGLLEAHAVLIKYVKLLEEKKIAISELNASFGRHLELMRSIGENLSPLAAQLIFCLTPNRAFALGRLPAHIIATAYLSTEAGKCLVFKRHNDGFNKISHYPHLQARAILHSLVSYHQEHKGEARLLIRQAIYSSRRHGDFGRAFLPERMSVESRALRDWLEIMYSDPAKREASAQLVELDAHVEEIGINWRLGYARRVRAWHEQEHLNMTPAADAPPYQFWKGMVYKSVILMPVSDLISIALRGIDEARINRMNDLIKLTRRVQFNLSVMARLPGFKRMALETQQGSGEGNPYFNGGRQELLKRWTVVRRMLTHYNWLSTRVGDYSVPYDGLIHCIARFPEEANPKNRVFVFEAMVPFRQRRCEELFGKQWEQNYFFDSPHPTMVEAFVDRSKYHEALAARTFGSNFLRPESGDDARKSAGASDSKEKLPEPGSSLASPKGGQVASG